MDEGTYLLNCRQPNYSLLPTTQNKIQQLDHAEELQTTKIPRVTCTLAYTIAACVLGSSFLIGYNTGVVNSPAGVIKQFYNATYTERTGHSIPSYLLTILWGITVSSYAAGGMFGGVSAGYFANRYGRRGALLRNNALTLVAAALLGFSKLSKSYEMLIAGRFISGVNAGINSGLAPLYLCEISPVALRGLCATFNQVAICFGIFVSQLAGLNLTFGTDDLWPLTFVMIVVPSVWMLLAFPPCPESPRFLMVTKNDGDEAEKDVSEGFCQQFLVRDLFMDRSLYWPLIICVVLHLSQQFSGINAVIYYSTAVFEQAGLSIGLAQYATVGTGLVNIVMSFIAAVLVDKLGRRMLMITGLAGMLAFTVLLTASLVLQPSLSWMSYVSIAAITLYIVAFATGPGAIPWFYVAEVFSQGPRSAAVSVSVLVNWAANFTVGLVFPILQDSIDEYAFVPFAVMLLSFLLFVIAFAPETKGRRIEDITIIFQVDGGDGHSAR